MKLRIVIVGLLLLISSGIIAQTANPDPRLLEKYAPTYLNNLKENSPRTLDYLNFSIDNAWFISENIGEKYQSLPELKYINISTGESGNTVENIDTENINIYSFFFEQGFQNRTYYRIANTGIVLGFYSIEELSENYNQQKGLHHE